MDQKANGVEPGLPVDPAAGANFRGREVIVEEWLHPHMGMKARRGMSHAFRGGPCHRHKPRPSLGRAGGCPDAPATGQPIGAEHEGYQPADPTGSAAAEPGGADPDGEQPDPPGRPAGASLSSALIGSASPRRLPARLDQLLEPRTQERDPLLGSIRCPFLDESIVGRGPLSPKDALMTGA